MKTIAFSRNHNETIGKNNAENLGCATLITLLHTAGFNLIDLEQPIHQSNSVFDILVLAEPKTDVVDREIDKIIDLYRHGIGILFISAGFQEVNHLNDAASKFGGYFNNDCVIDNEKAMYPEVVRLRIDSQHSIFENVNEIYYSFGCTLSWHNSNNFKLTTQPHCIPSNSAICIWNHEEHCGAFVAIGSREMFSDTAQYGIGTLDNAEFIRNIFAWLAGFSHSKYENSQENSDTVYGMTPAEQKDQHQPREIQVQRQLESFFSDVEIRRIIRKMGKLESEIASCENEIEACEEEYNEIRLGRGDEDRMGKIKKTMIATRGELQEKERELRENRQALASKLRQHLEGDS